MGTKTWMLVYADSNAREALRTNPQLDRQSTQTLATTLFPREKLEAVGDADLSYSYPPVNELRRGCFPGVSIIAAKEFGIDRPSMLPQRFIIPAGAGIVTLRAMDSMVYWVAFAQWTNGRLLRSLGLSANSGILEDIGKRLAFEEPFWSGEHPAVDEYEEEEDGAYPFPFHPLDLGEAALEELFGYLKPELVPLVRYKRSL